MTKWLHNGNGTMLVRIFMLIFQGVIMIGMFWAGATFVHKTDFDAYKETQDNRRVETLKAMSEIASTMARIDQRLQDSEKQQKP